MQAPFFIAYFCRYSSTVVRLFLFRFLFLWQCLPLSAGALKPSASFGCSCRCGRGTGLVVMVERGSCPLPECRYDFCGLEVYRQAGSRNAQQHRSATRQMLPADGSIQQQGRQQHG